MAIQDGYSEQQSGRAAKDCHNNYVWISHANGEWTNYSHIAHDTVTKQAGLKVGDRGFLTDNDNGRRERNPRFCGVPGGFVVKGATYRSGPC